MIDRLLQNNTAVKILSIILAFILWLYIAGDTTGAPGFDLTRDFIRGVTVETYNLAGNLEIADMVEEVDVAVQGPSERLVGLTPDDLEIYVDLGELRGGEHQVKVRGNAPYGVEIENIYPSQIQVIIDEIITRQMEVTPQLEGEPVEGYVISDVQVEPESILLEGASRILVNVEELWAVVNISELEEDSNLTVPLKPVDDTGEEITGLEITPSEVDVFVKVDYFKKEVPVEVNIEGELPEGLEIKSIEAEPERVVLLGDEELLEEVNKVKTAVLDLSDKEETFFQEIELEVPQGTSLEIEPRASVMVVIGPVEE